MSVVVSAPPSSRAGVQHDQRHRQQPQPDMRSHPNLRAPDAPDSKQSLAWPEQEFEQDQQSGSDSKRQTRRTGPAGPFARAATRGRIPSDRSDRAEHEQDDPLPMRPRFLRSTSKASASNGATGTLKRPSSPCSGGRGLLAFLTCHKDGVKLRKLLAVGRFGSLYRHGRQADLSNLRILLTGLDRIFATARTTGYKW